VLFLLLVRFSPASLSTRHLTKAPLFSFRSINYSTPVMNAKLVSITSKTRVKPRHTKQPGTMTTEISVRKWTATKTCHVHRNKRRGRLIHRRGRNGECSPNRKGISS
jgi:hypothetical protein